MLGACRLRSRAFKSQALNLESQGFMESGLFEVLESDRHHLYKDDCKILAPELEA